MHKLRTIECNYLDSNRRKTEMLYLWLRSASHPTWEAVIDALCVDGKLFSCLEYKKRIHQLYHYWYVFTTLQVQIYIPIWQIVVTLVLFIAILFLPYLYRAVNMYLLC